MLVISMLVFTGVYAVGNPIDVLLSPDATQQIREQTIKAYGLDQPLWRQYFAFLGRLFSGDFGRSFIFNMPVLQLILSRLPATLELTVIAVLGATLVGVPLGMFAGYKPGSAISKLIMAVSVLGFSVPTFWIGLVLILTFAVTLGWLPAGGRGETAPLLGAEWSFLTLNGWHHLILPALNLVAVQVCHDGPSCPRRHARDHADRYGEVRPRRRRERVDDHASPRAAADRNSDRHGISASSSAPPWRSRS